TSGGVSSIKYSVYSVYYTSGGVHSIKYSAAVVPFLIQCKRCIQYLIQCVQFLLHFWWCTQYTIQCSVVLQNKIYIMFERPPRRGRRSQATKRGQAGSVSTVNSGRGACLSFFSAAGRVIEPEHAEELVEWITKPSSSSSSSVTQAQSSLPSKTAAKAAYSTGFLSTVTPSIAPPSCMEESPELFDHNVRYKLLEDAQRFEGSDVGSQVEEGSNVSLERWVAQEGQETGSHVPPAAAYCQVCSSDEEGGDDEVTDCTWVPKRREKEKAQLQRGRMSSRGQLKGNQPIASHCRAPQVQGAARYVCSRLHCCCLQPMSEADKAWPEQQLLGHHMLDQTYDDLPCSLLATALERSRSKKKADFSLLHIWDLQPYYTSSPLKNLH
ncbi:hypothetical protein AB205_0044590, partial [Aquarana catesbeiana]